MLSVQELVTLLRQSLNITKTITVEDENGEMVEVEVSVTKDKAYLNMTDEDIILYLKLCASRDYQIDDLEDLPMGAEYPLILLTQIELFKKLAVSVADWIDLGADNNNYIKRNQRFNHYMELSQNAKAQYDEYVRTGGATGGVQTYNTRLKSKHQSTRDYELTPTPRVSVKIKNITNDSADISWSVSNVSHFGRYKVYVSPSQIVDEYLDGSSAESKLLEGALLVKSTSDIRNNTHRVKGLKPSTEYHIAVFSIERNSVWGCTEKVFTTLEEFKDEEDVEIEDLPIEGGEEPTEPTDPIEPPIEGEETPTEPNDGEVEEPTE